MIADRAVRILVPASLVAATITDGRARPFHNRSDETLRFGNSANDETCNLEGYVFRDMELPPESRGQIGAVLLPPTP